MHIVISLISSRGFAHIVFEGAHIGRLVCTDFVLSAVGDVPVKSETPIVILSISSRGFVGLVFEDARKSRVYIHAYECLICFVLYNLKKLINRDSMPA